MVSENYWLYTQKLTYEVQSIYGKHSLSTLRCVNFSGKLVIIMSRHGAKFPLIGIVCPCNWKTEHSHILVRLIFLVSQAGDRLTYSTRCITRYYYVQF